ncbi:MAG: hypothetical protein RI894_556, partial [Bacteroidota bacterium]
HRRKTFNDFKYLLYDTTLLHILRHEKLPAAAIFSTLFRKNPTARVLRFLSNESSLIDDIYIMQSVPTRPFLIAFLKEFYKIAVKSPLPQPHFSADAAAIFTNFIKILKEKIDGVF